MMDDILMLVKNSRVKVMDALSLLEASLRTVEVYDSKKEYTPKEREPYDALCDRFIRAVEISIKFFRSYELYLYADGSESLRDLLHRMEKHGLISALPLWFAMRQIRNRIVHDYSPDGISVLYGEIMSDMGDELMRLKIKASQLDFIQ